MAARRYTGTVTRFNHHRAFGFVKIDSAGLPEAFFHLAAFPPHVGGHEIGTGTKIEFYLEQAPRGLKAIRANII